MPYRRSDDAPYVAWIAIWQAMYDRASGSERVHLPTPFQSSVNVG
jgi:hypothetical protein